LAPSELNFFPKLKTKVHGRCFGAMVSWRWSISSLRTKVEFYFEGFNKLEYMWAKCTDVESDYIEK
jgi:hypothetical protein